VRLWSCRGSEELINSVGLKVMSLAIAVRRIAPARSAPHSVCKRNMRHYPSQAAQDRSVCACECPPDQNFDAVELSGSACLGQGCRAPPGHNKRARLAGLTRGAAPR